MHTTRNSRLAPLLLLLSALAMSGCANRPSATPPSPPPPAKVQLTPLPSKALKDDSPRSASFLKKREDWLSKQERLFGSETAK